METVPWDYPQSYCIICGECPTDGSLSQTKRWGDIAKALTYAKTYSVRVHLTVVNFDTEELRTLLGDETARSRLIQTLKDIVDDTGVDGVNIDFEGVPAERRDAMVSFIRELSEVVDEVVVASPAVIVERMGLRRTHRLCGPLHHGVRHHWSGYGAGPVDLLYGGGPSDPP